MNGKREHPTELVSAQTIASLMVQIEGLRGAVDHTNENIKNTKSAIENMDFQMRWFCGAAFGIVVGLVGLGGYFVDHMDKRIEVTQQLIQNIKGDRDE